MCGVKGRTPPARCLTLRAVRRERSRRSGRWRGAGASRGAWTPVIHRRFLRAERSPMPRMGRSGSRRWTERRSCNNWLCGDKTSTRTGLRMGANWRLFRRETITRSSVFATFARRPCISWRRLWIQTVIPRGRWTGSASPSCGDRRRQGTRRRATLLHRISRIRGPSGWRTPPRERQEKYGTAARRCRDRFPIWQKTPAAG